VSLFSFIAREGISNIVFLCGDSHLSMHTKIEFLDNRGSLQLRATCIMASAMYAPYPFVNSSVHDFEPDAELQLPGVGSMRYEVTRASDCDGFTRVTAREAPVEGGWEIGSSVVPAGEVPPPEAERALAV
jgi:hypothetical protein